MFERLILVVCVASALAPPSAFGQAAPLAPIEQSALAKDAFSSGLLDRSSGALGADLWRGAETATLEMLLQNAPARPSSPAIGSALRRVLLTAGETPSGSTPALGGAKLKALARAGFGEEARQIESLSAGAKNDPASAEAMAIADIYANELASACEKGRRVSSGLDQAFWVRLRVVCYASQNELDAAELALGILRENGRLGDIDEALLAPLASGGKAKAGVAPVDAVHYAALKAMGTPLNGPLPASAEGGVVKAAANDAAADWPTRLAAAKRALFMGVMNADEMKRLYGSAPGSAAGAYSEIRAMAAPELLRDRTGRIAAEIEAAGDVVSLYAVANLYADEIRDAEGAILPAKEAASLALARLAAGDAVGAERWLLSAAGEIGRGVPDAQSMRFIDLVSVLGVLEPAGARRVAAAANVAAGPPRTAPDAEIAAPSPALAPIVAAAIDAARLGGAGEAALAALAASDAASAGDPIAAALLPAALRAAGLSDIVRRLAVEDAISAMFAQPAPMGISASATPVSASKVTPRLKPKRST